MIKKKQCKAMCYIQIYIRSYKPFNYGKQLMQGFTIERVEQKNCVLAFNCLLVATF
jgi:hypothetical protein